MRQDNLIRVQSGAESKSFQSLAVFFTADGFLHYRTFLLRIKYHQLVTSIGQEQVFIFKNLKFFKIRILFNLKKKNFLALSS